jgi:hypothetical protein
MAENNTGAIAAVGAVAIAAGVGYYIYTQSKGAAPPQGPPSSSSGPVISLSTSQVSISSGLFGNIYTPSTLIVTGSGFTPGASVKILDEIGDILNTTTATATGTISIGTAFSSYNPAAGTGSIRALDTVTGQYSQPQTITYSSSSSSTPPSTQSLTLAVSPSSATMNDTIYFSVAGLAPGGTWELYADNNSFAAAQQSGSGNASLTYYLSSTSPLWKLMATKSSVSIYVHDYGSGQNSPAITLSNTNPLSYGTQSNPYIFGSWQGPGYYTFIGTGGLYYVSNQTQYNTDVNSGGGGLGTQANPYNASSGWQGTGWYTFPTSILTIPASGVTSNPTYVSSQSFYSSAMSWA